MKKTRKQGMFLSEVQLYHIWSLKPDLLSLNSSVCLPLFYEKKRKIYCSFFREGVVGVFGGGGGLVAWLITAVFTDARRARCARRSFRRRANKEYKHA